MTGTLYKGYEPYFRMQEEGRLEFGAVVNAAGSIYVVGDIGLYDPRQELLVDPEEVLSKRDAPSGWRLENVNENLLPEDEIRYFKERHSK
jgi:hypothetical protein